MKHHSCDRCGRPCLPAGVGLQYAPMVDFGTDPEPVDVQIEMTRPVKDGEPPDLCDRCRAYILNLVAAQLTERSGS